MTPGFLKLLRSHASAEAYRQLAPDDLWARVRDHLDEAAFRVLLERVGSRVYQRCRSVLRDDHLAEEAFQDTFCDLIRKRAAVPTYRAAAAWAYQTAANHARHRRRKQWRQVVRPAPAGPAEARDPAAAIDAADAAARALAALPARYRRPLELVFWDGLTHAEAAAALGWPTGTVDSYVARGLKRLRAQAGRLGLPSAGAVGLEAALARPAAAVGREAVDKVIARAWAAGGPAGAAGATGWWGGGWTKAAVTSVALGATAAAGAWLGGPPRDKTDPPAAPPPPAAPVETLQARNLRRAADLAGTLRDLLQRSYPPDNPVLVTAVRAAGSEVEFEFRPSRPPADPTLSGRVRARYCTLRRHLDLRTQPTGSPRWHWVDPGRPRVVRLPLPYGRAAELVRGRDELAEAARLLSRLPADPRAEAEQVRALFGLPGGGLLLPADSRGTSGFPGGLVLATESGGLFVRDAAGRWRYAGECPGWFPTVVGDRVYCLQAGAVLARPLADPAAGWEACGAYSRGPAPGPPAAAAGRWFVQVGPELCSRPLGDPAAGWERAVSPLVMHVLAAVGDTLYGTDGRALLSRPAASPTATWTAAGPWPTGCRALAADGDRLLAYGGPGPIYARPTAAAADEPWTVVGRVHDPYAP